MLPDRGVDVACGVGSGELARERVKILHFGFTPARELSLSFEIGCQMAGNDRNEHEEREFDQMLRVLHEKAVDRRIEEKR